jgi:hypothetical protein
MHVNFILKICSQRAYPMRKLRDQGLTANHLNIVFDAINMSRITCGLCAWSGFLSFELIGRVDAFFRHMFRYGFCDRLLTFCDINCDNTLIKLMLNSHSCIHQLRSSVQNEILQLRHRGHKFTLPNCRPIFMETLLSIAASLPIYNFIYRPTRHIIIITF